MEFLVCLTIVFLYYLLKNSLSKRDFIRYKGVSLLFILKEKLVINSVSKKTKYYNVFKPYLLLFV